jgi:hypothetical protein
MTTWTTSEAARHVRAELETIAAGFQLRELARLLEFGRRLVDEQVEATGMESNPKLEPCGSRSF